MFADPKQHLKLEGGLVRCTRSMFATDWMASTKGNCYSRYAVVLSVYF